MSILLRNAFVIDLNSTRNAKTEDVFIEDGIISLKPKSKPNRELDLNGKWLTPGWFDLNANFNDPGNEHKEDLLSGSTLASNSGFTDVNVSPNTLPPIESKSDVDYLMQRSLSKVDLHVTAALSEKMLGENLNEILDLHSAGARSFSDGDDSIWNSELLIKALEYTSKIDVPVFQNARDKHLTVNTHMHEAAMSTYLGLRGEPSLSEELMIMRDIEILKYSGGRIHFTKISTAKSVSLIREAKRNKLKVTCDVCIHQLLFTDECVRDFDTSYKVRPPYRSEKDRKALVKGVNDGIIDAISSNHRPHDQESKQLEFDLADFGNTSLQTFFPSLLKLSSEIPFDVLIDRITNGPRAVLGFSNIYIEEGQPAKLTILDPNAKWKLDRSTNLSKSMNSPFWNQELLGEVFGTINIDTYSIYK